MTDAHLHLQDVRLDPVREEYLASLPAAGIRAIVVNGTSESDWETVASLAAQHSRVIPFFGVHPWWAGSESADWSSTLENLLIRHPRSGVGEIGLDRWIRDGDFERQKEVFATQLDLAARHSRPVALHCLQAWGILLEMCREKPPSCGLLLHSYGGPPEMVEDFVALGAYFSISGYFFRPGKEAKLAAFASLPLDRLLIETDAPDMALPEEKWSCRVPGDPKGTLNHPGNLGAVYAAVASLRGLDPEELETQVTRNFTAWLGQQDATFSNTSERLSTP